MRIGVVIPVFNEKDRIGPLLARFSPGLVDRVVAVDDGSTDGTQDIVAASAAARIRHETRQGVGAAIRDGLLLLKEQGFDVAVVMAGNGKDDPADIPALTAPLKDGRADYVQGSRFLAGGSFKNLPLPRLLMIKSFTWLWSALMLRRLTDVTNGFRAYRLSLLDDPRVDVRQPWLERYELEYYLHFKALALGWRFAEVAVSKDYPTRTGYSKIRPLLDWWSIVKPLLLLRFGLRS